MKNLIILSIIVLFAGSVYADNLFQDTNPFPQTVPHSMNNIYQSEPSVIKQEEKQNVKQSWWKRGRKHASQTSTESSSKLPVYPVENRQQHDGSYYVFTTGE